jgi:hypothetical protein
MVNNRFNPAADPYSDYNLAMRPGNRDYSPTSGKPYEAEYQRIMKEMRDGHGFNHYQPDLDIFSKWNAMKDKATSQHPKPLIQLLEQFKRPLANDVLTVRSDGAYTQHKTNPDHWNSAALLETPDELNGFKEYKNYPKTYIQSLIKKINNGELLLNSSNLSNLYQKPGVDEQSWSGLANAGDAMGYNLTPYFHTEPSGAKPVISLLRKGSETIPVSNANLSPSSFEEILQQQKQIAEQLPLTEYLQYILKHGKAPF